MIADDLKHRLKALSLEDLAFIQHYIAGLIDSEKQKSKGKRSEDRFKTSMRGTCTIEREKEFYNVPHKIVLSDISTGGLSFKTSALLFLGDILTITFRSPHKGKLKDVYAEVVRVGKADQDGEIVAGAKGIAFDKVREHRKMLKTRKEENI